MVLEHSLKVSGLNFVVFNQTVFLFDRRIGEEELLP
jgi:hypothetical protein